MSPGSRKANAACPTPSFAPIKLITSVLGSSFTLNLLSYQLAIASLRAGIPSESGYL